MKPVDIKEPEPDKDANDEIETPPLNADVPLLSEASRQALERELNPDAAEPELPVDLEPEPTSKLPVALSAKVNTKEIERHASQLRSQAATAMPAEPSMNPYDAQIASQMPMVFVSKRPMQQPVYMPPPPPVATPTDNKFAKDSAAASGNVAQQQFSFLQAAQRAPEAKASFHMRQAMMQAASPAKPKEETATPPPIE